MEEGGEITGYRPRDDPWRDGGGEGDNGGCSSILRCLKLQMMLGDYNKVLVAFEED